MLPGLVGQQIDSFDEFIRYTIQELVYDTGEITMTPEDQYINSCIVYLINSSKESICWPTKPGSIKNK